MKKIFAVMLLTVFSLPFLTAQESTFNLGDKVINLGIGLGGSLYNGTYYKTTFPPVSISFEKAIKDQILEKGVIGVGGMLGYSAHKWEYAGYGWKYTNFIIGARGSFHYPLVDKLDTYAGLIIGYNIATTKEFGTPIGFEPSSTGGLVASGFIGARYYFATKIAAFAELGYGISYLNIGIAFKL
jgi:hypothetical protein